MMKKLLLLFVASFLTISLLQAQGELTLSWEGEPLGDTVLVVGDPNPPLLEILFHAQVTNNTDDAMTIMVFREQIEVLENAIDLFCWGLCYSPAVDTSLLNITIKADSTSKPEEFSGHYQPNGVIGTSIIKYTFYDMNNPDTRTSVVCKFKASPESVAEEAMQGGFISEVYPNPARNSVTLDYLLTPKVQTANVQVFNVMGAVVKEADLRRGSSNMSMDITDLKSGIYFYSVIINDDVYKTKKLIIQR